MWLVTLHADRRARFAQLLWVAAEQQVADEQRRAEILQWTRRAADDGIPARSYGNLLPCRQPAGPHPPRGAVRSSVDHAVFLAFGPVVVLLTDGDDRPDWLRAGLALRLLLAATATGQVASFLNQVVQREPCRDALAALLGEAGRHPQGRSADRTAAGRRTAYAAPAVDPRPAPWSGPTLSSRRSSPGPKGPPSSGPRPRLVPGWAVLAWGEVHAVRARSPGPLPEAGEVKT